MGIQNKITENVSSQCFMQKNAKMDANQPISRNIKNINKKVYFEFLSLLPRKKKTTLYRETKGHYENRV